MKTVTGMGGMGGARELAEMLRQMGRGPDTMLAHITPEEAEMLMQMGGSGEMNPNTGLPEFQPYSDYEYDAYANMDRVPSPIMQEYEGPDVPFDSRFTAAPPSSMPTMPAPLPVSMDQGFSYVPNRFQESLADFNVMPRRDVFEQFTAAQTQPEPSPFARAARGVEDVFEQGRDLARQYPNIANILATTGQSLPALLQASRARREGERAAQELRALGAPLRQQGEALRQQALTGGLTPQQARQQEASRARLRQAASTRGATTGTQQAMIEGQLGRERAAMAETNLNNALKQLNLANAYDEAAIRAMLASDQQVAQSLQNVFNNLSRRLGAQGSEGQQQQAPAPVQQASAPIFPEKSITQRPGDQR